MTTYSLIRVSFVFRFSVPKFLLQKNEVVGGVRFIEELLFLHLLGFYYLVRFLIFI